MFQRGKVVCGAMSEAVGMVPGLEMMLFHSWCCLFNVGDFLC